MPTFQVNVAFNIVHLLNAKEPQQVATTLPTSQLMAKLV